MPMIPQNKAKATAYTAKQKAARAARLERARKEHLDTLEALENMARKFYRTEGLVTMIICNRGRK